MNDIKLIVQEYHSNELIDVQLPFLPVPGDWVMFEEYQILVMTREFFVAQNTMILKAQKFLFPTKC